MRRPLKDERGPSRPLPKYTFDYRGLFEALDANRVSRNMTWRQVSVEVGVAVATLMRTRLGGPMEADGVRAMVAWLGRAPEHFVLTRPHRRQSLAGASPAPKSRLDRIDTTALYGALDRLRRSRGLTWIQLASEIGGSISPSMLTRLRRRGRVGMDVLVACAGWLGAGVDSFT